MHVLLTQSVNHCNNLLVRYNFNSRSNRYSSKRIMDESTHRYPLNLHEMSSNYNDDNHQTGTNGVRMFRFNTGHPINLKSIVDTHKIKHAILKSNEMTIQIVVDMRKALNWKSNFCLFGLMSPDRFNKLGKYSAECNDINFSVMKKGQLLEYTFVDSRSHECHKAQHHTSLNKYMGKTTSYLNIIMTYSNGDKIVYINGDRVIDVKGKSGDTIDVSNWRNNFNFFIGAGPSIEHGAVDIVDIYQVSLWDRRFGESEIKNLPLIPSTSCEKKPGVDSKPIPVKILKSVNKYSTQTFNKISYGYDRKMRGRKKTYEKRHPKKGPIGTYVKGKCCCKKRLGGKKCYSEFDSVKVAKCWCGTNPGGKHGSGRCKCSKKKRTKNNHQSSFMNEPKKKTKKKKDKKKKTKKKKDKKRRDKKKKTKKKKDKKKKDKKKKDKKRRDTKKDKNCIEECMEPSCGKCDGKIDTLSLKYIGNIHDAQIKVCTCHGNSHNSNPCDEEILNTIVQPNGLFQISASPDLGTQICINLGNDVTRIHTSCSKPITIGSVFGDYIIKSGSSKKGGPFCDEPQIPPTKYQCKLKCKGTKTFCTESYETLRGYCRCPVDEPEKPKRSTCKSCTMTLYWGYKNLNPFTSLDITNWNLTMTVTHNMKVLEKGKHYKLKHNIPDHIKLLPGNHPYVWTTVVTFQNKSCNHYWFKSLDGILAGLSFTDPVTQNPVKHQVATKFENGPGFNVVMVSNNLPVQSSTQSATFIATSISQPLPKKIIQCSMMETPGTSRKVKIHLKNGVCDEKIHFNPIPIQQKHPLLNPISYYSYGNPTAFTFNSPDGFGVTKFKNELKDRNYMMMVKYNPSIDYNTGNDATNNGSIPNADEYYLYWINDIPEDGTGGDTDIKMEPSTRFMTHYGNNKIFYPEDSLTNPLHQSWNWTMENLALYDDPVSPTQDKVSFNYSGVHGSLPHGLKNPSFGFKWKWYPCCTDGKVFGPFRMNQCANIKIESSSLENKPISIISFNPTQQNPYDFEIIHTNAKPVQGTEIKLCMKLNNGKSADEIKHLNKHCTAKKYKWLKTNNNARHCPSTNPCNPDRCGVCNGNGHSCHKCKGICKRKKVCVIEHTRCKIIPPTRYTKSNGKSIRLEDILDAKYTLFANASIIHGDTSAKTLFKCHNETDPSLMEEIRTGWMTYFDIDNSFYCPKNSTTLIKYKLFKQRIELRKLYECVTGNDSDDITIDNLEDTIQTLNAKFSIVGFRFKHNKKKLIYKVPCRFTIHTKIKPCPRNETLPPPCVKCCKCMNRCKSSCKIRGLFNWSTYCQKRCKRSCKDPKCCKKCVTSHGHISITNFSTKKLICKSKVLEHQFKNGNLGIVFRTCFNIMNYPSNVVQKFVRWNVHPVHGFPMTVTKPSRCDPYKLHHDKECCQVWKLKTTQHQFTNYTSIQYKAKLHVNFKALPTGVKIKSTICIDIVRHPNGIKGPPIRVKGPPVFVEKKPKKKKRLDIHVKYYADKHFKVPSSKFYDCQRVHMLITLYKKKVRFMNNTHSCGNNPHCLRRTIVPMGGHQHTRYHKEVDFNSGDCPLKNTTLKLKPQKIYLCIPSIDPIGRLVKDCDSVKGQLIELLDLSQPPYNYYGGNQWKSKIRYDKCREGDTNCLTALRFGFRLCAICGNMRRFPLFTIVEWNVKHMYSIHRMGHHHTQHIYDQIGVRESNKDKYMLEYANNNEHQGCNTGQCPRDQYNEHVCDSFQIICEDGKIYEPLFWETCVWAPIYWCTFICIQFKIAAVSSLLVVLICFVFGCMSYCGFVHDNRQEVHKNRCHIQEEHVCQFPCPRNCHIQGEHDCQHPCQQHHQQQTIIVVDPHMKKRRTTNKISLEGSLFDMNYEGKYDNVFTIEEN